MQFRVHVQIFLHFLAAVNTNADFSAFVLAGSPPWRVNMAVAKTPTEEALSKKERQAMEILYRLGEATAAQVQAEMPDQPTYSAVRGLLGVLVEKRHAKAAKPNGARHYVYAPKEPIQKAREGAVSRLLSTFFDDSPSQLVANLLDPAERRMSPAEIEELQALIDAQRAARDLKR